MGNNNLEEKGCNFHLPIKERAFANLINSRKLNRLCLFMRILIIIISKGSHFTFIQYTMLRSSQSLFSVAGVGFVRSNLSRPRSTLVYASSVWFRTARWYSNDSLTYDEVVTGTLDTLSEKLLELEDKIEFQGSNFDVQCSVREN